MPKTPPQLEALVSVLPKLSEDALRTVFEVCVARMKVRAGACLAFAPGARWDRASPLFIRIGEVLLAFWHRNKKWRKRPTSSLSLVSMQLGSTQLAKLQCLRYDP